MAEIVNLNRMRKQRERQRQKRQAAENRVRHGVPKAKVDSLQETMAKEKADLDGKHLTGKTRDDR